MSNSQNANTEVLWRRLYLSRAKLKAISRTSALLSGFAMVAMVEIQTDEKPPVPQSGNSSSSGGGINGNEQTKKVPDTLLVVFGACTTLLVTIHLVALMISTCILPNLEVVSSSSDHNSLQGISQSPHEKMRHYVEAAWICSTGLGILLFLVEIGLLCWVKFYAWSPNAATASTIIVIPAAVLFIAFSLLFYRRLMQHKHERHEQGLRELQEMAHDLNTRSRHQDSLCVHLV